MGRTTTKWVQDALYENENDARSAKTRAIDLYKADRNIGKKEKARVEKVLLKQLRRKVKRLYLMLKEKSTKIKESDVQKMSAEQYEKNADMIMEAIRSGNFVYDLSGSAR